MSESTDLREVAWFVLGLSPRSPLSFALALCSGLVFTPAYAHDQWIVPQTVGAELHIALRVGEHLDQAEVQTVKDPASTARFELRSGATVRDLRGSLQAGVDPVATTPLQPSEAGTLLLAYDGATHDITLDPEKFDAYLADEGLVVAQRARAGKPPVPGRERYSRCMKSLLVVGAPGGGVVTAPIGQELEIVPLEDPYLLTNGADLPVEIRFKGLPLAGAQVLGAHRLGADPSVSTTRVTDSAGHAAIPLNGSGDWIVAMVWMIPSTEPGADWRSYWASLTFSRP